MLTYMAEIVQSDGVLSPPIIPRGFWQGVLPLVPSASWLCTGATSMTAKRSVSNLDVWIDDVSLDSVHASAKNRLPLTLFFFSESLRKEIEAREAKFERARRGREPPHLYSPHCFASELRSDSRFLCPFYVRR